MIRISHVDVYNWHNANRGMRNSFASWDRIDSMYLAGHDGSEWHYGPDDYALAMRLAKAGASHRKFMRQILVSADITAGNEWWKEFDTYKVGTTSNSTSLMHKLGSRLLTSDDFSFDDPHDPFVTVTIANVNDAIERWWRSGKQVGSYEWRRLQKLVPMGIVYTRTVTLNYEVLRTMFHDRKGHRLAEWREFCDWIRTLPYSELITGEATAQRSAE